MTPGMQAVVLICLFILGSVVGSFINVCVYRWPRGESIVRPRSRCPACKHAIAARDNIPILSYLLLGGRCRHCGRDISIRYPIIELVTAAAFAVLGGVFAGRGETVAVTAVYLALAGAMILCSFVDLEFRIIPDEVTIPGLIIAPVVSLVVPALHDFAAAGRRPFGLFVNVRLNCLADCALGMLVGAGLTYLTGVLGKMIFRKEAMGFGDVKYMGVIGGVLGVKFVVLTFFVAPLIGVAVGVFMVMGKREHTIPYAPFLSMAAALVMVLGAAIWRFIISPGASLHRWI